ncbi:MAG: HDIG domain-containing protein [Bacteroidales bacterium]|nr:HDIG domain-containing protein [Bacteroidales bacterium]
MKQIWEFLRQNYSNFYKAGLFLISLVILISFFPKEAKFKYEFSKGRPWPHEDLIAPFDFPILKAPEEIEKERNEILQEHELYFDFNINLNEEIRDNYTTNFELFWAAKYGVVPENELLKQITYDRGHEILTTILSVGILQTIPEIENKPPGYKITIIIQRIAERSRLSDLFTIHTAFEKLNEMLDNSEQADTEILRQLLEESLTQNIFYNESVTQTELQKYLDRISTTRGMVQEGEKIITKGEVINKTKFQILESLRTEYETKLGVDSNYYLILSGQILLVAISLTVLVFFLYFFRRDILEDNKKVLLILLVIILMVFLTSAALKFNVQYIYIVPLCIAPILIRVFFDTRLALYTYLITIIIIGFLVPNSFQFLFMQLIAGIITIFSIVNLQKRAQFLFTSVVVFASYSAIYTGLNLIQEGNFSTIRPVDYVLFGGSALLILFSYPLIYLFEKIFGLVTDVTLLELSNTNSKLLRELSRRAPGTFQHSLQVANLAEESIYEIGGDALLARTGALYHDIGKMDQPMYFIENQVTGVNPHDELTNEESARIIIGHVIKGIEKAKQAKLPEQIIDFIRTHHGTSRVGYFYAMEQKENPDEQVDAKRYTYPGPIPYSKETSVVMMADSVEAASRSLKIIDEETINGLVEGIISKQVDTGQFKNSPITLRDINTIKKILKKKLMNIYHIRIEYPK